MNCKANFQFLTLNYPNKCRENGNFTDHERNDTMKLRAEVGMKKCKVEVWFVCDLSKVNAAMMLTAALVVK